MRDKLVISVANFILGFASKKYRDLLSVTILLGIRGLKKLKEQEKAEAKKNKA